MVIITSDQISERLEGEHYLRNAEKKIDSNCVNSEFCYFSDNIFQKRSKDIFRYWNVLPQRFLCFSSETTTALLIGYTPLKYNKFKVCEKK